jgi:hypothetical protein
MRIDGRPVPANASDSVQGKSEGEFGNLIGIIFDSAKGSELHWERTSSVNRVVTDVIAFRVPGSNGYILTERKRLTRVPFDGFVYADAQTHAILRIQLKGMMFPADSRYQALELMVDYKPTRVAGQEFILPSHFVLSYRTDELSQSNTADFMQYRRFGADTSIQFDSDAQ